MSSVEQEQDSSRHGSCLSDHWRTLHASSLHLVPSNNRMDSRLLFSGSDLDANGEHYTVAGVYSTFYSSRDIIWTMDYAAPFYDREWHGDVGFINSALSNRTKEAQIQVIFTNKNNQVLDTHQLRPGPGAGLFASSYHGELRIYLGSPLSSEELQEKGCYGNWNVTFSQSHYPILLDTSPSLRGQFIRYFVLGIELIAIVAGLALTKLSQRRKT